MENSIEFFSEEIDFTLANTDKIASWLIKIAQNEGFQIEALNYIFCDDEYLHKINLQYLNHDIYTDIITFDNSDEDSETIDGDIFISIERVKENSQTLSIAFENELCRVMAHGLLHLMGYDDHSESDKKTMRSKENMALEIFEELGMI